MSEIIFSVSGVRGIYGDSLTPNAVLLYTIAFARFCKNNNNKKSKKIVVGRDGRLKGEEITAGVIFALTRANFEVIDIGVVPTPTVQLAVEKLKAAGGIAVTASHNPQEWNGLKFLDSDGTFLKSEQIDEVKENLKLKISDFVNIDNPFYAKEDTSWIDKHINYVLKLDYINAAKIRRRKFKVVVDAVNASGSVIVPKLLKKLGCEVVELYCSGSGKFPHLPEPLPHNLKLLSAGVRKHKADIGFAIDPDGDRLVLICEDGKPFIEENTIVTVVRNVLKHSKKKNNKVCVNMSTTRAVEDVAKVYGASVSRTPVGEINVVNEMKRVKAIVGGEGSGGVIVPKVHYGRDASVGAALVLNELADFKGKVSEYKKSIPQYHIEKAKIETKGDPSKLLKRIEKEYKKKDCKISTLDGVKLDFAEYWIHLRKSNTEPIIRIITEAKSKKEAVKIQTLFLKNLNY